ncbi:MAG TPA: YdeI/OmpD-associated family protein, partial [Cyclobacteriaceae bacterium]|nr:YdeI/OmpD-associated family protein [Cyclobacteriaceae bacterium]
MISYTTKIKRFEKNGEKTGWSFIEISKRQATQLNPGVRVSFRVKGTIDQHPIQKTSIIPMGDGNFILPINGTIRKATGKAEGDTITVRLELDERKFTLLPIFMKCLKDDPRALNFFKTLPKSHQNYFSKWIESAKTSGTKTRRITMAV